MSTLVLDIETAPLPSDKLAVPEFKAPANLKDPAKIEAAIAEKRKEWEATLALHAETARVLVVGTMKAGGEWITADRDSGEEAILSWAWSVIKSNDIIIGHNLRGFDLPLLIRRSYILGVKVPPVMEGRFLARKFVDTMDAWACGTQERISLANLARVLGVGEKSGSGADFASLYQTDRKAALAYLENDLRLTWAVAERMGLA